MAEDKKVVEAHDQFETLKEVIHYEDHDKRTESAEFRAVKKKLHAAKTPCYISNGHCEGHLEVHHSIIEYSASSETDWDKVHADYPNFTDVDDEDQMMVLCEKHHRGIGTGIHKISYPAWILQKYLRSDALEKFEAAVKEMKDNGHADHQINDTAHKILTNGGK
jgi:hypothetical protein